MFAFGRSNGAPFGCHIAVLELFTLDGITFGSCRSVEKLKNVMRCADAKFVAVRCVKIAWNGKRQYGGDAVAFIKAFEFFMVTFGHLFFGFPCSFFSVNAKQTIVLKF